MRHATPDATRQRIRTAGRSRLGSARCGRWACAASWSVAATRWAECHRCSDDVRLSDSSPACCSRGAYVRPDFERDKPPGAGAAEVLGSISKEPTRKAKGCSVRFRTLCRSLRAQEDRLRQLCCSFSLASPLCAMQPTASHDPQHHPGFIKHLERPRRIGTFAFAWSPKGALDAGLVADRTMEKAVPYAISALLVGFGALILIVGLSSSSPTLWTLVALIPITIGIVSAFGPM